MCKINLKTDFGIVLGSSMLPTFGTVNFISITPRNYYKIGDIISFKSHTGRYYNHRIVKLDDKWFTTKGDNLEIQDYETNVPIKNIRGTVKLIWRIKG